MNEDHLKIAEFIAYIIASVAGLIYVVDTIVIYIKGNSDNKIILINNDPRFRKVPSRRKSSIINPKESNDENDENYLDVVFD